MTLARSGAVGTRHLLVDSVAALTPASEGEIGDSHGPRGAYDERAMRKLAGAETVNTLLIFINQIRMKIGVMFGNPETTTGGNAEILRLCSS